MSQITPSPHYKTACASGRWRRYDTGDGLSSVGIYAITQDAHGRLWFGTSDGLSVFDGLSWTTYTRRDGLADNAIWALTFDGNDSLWIATYLGLSRYDGNEWETFSKSDGLSDDRVRAICVLQSGDLLAGAYGGPCLYNGRKWTRLPIEVDYEQALVVNTLLEDGDGGIWIGTQHGVWRPEGGAWQRDTDENGLPDNRVRALSQDADGHMWAGTPGGLCVYRDRVWESVPLTDHNGGVNLVNTLLRDHDGMLWAGTDNGLYKYDGSTWQRAADIGLDLGSPMVNTLFEDREGLLWAGTQNGLSVYDPSIVTVESPNHEIMKETVTALTEDKTHLWIGTFGGGLYRTDGKTWSSWSTADGLPGNRVRVLAGGPEGMVIVGTNGGLVLCRSESLVRDTTDDGSEARHIRAVAQDRLGRLWIGTNEGVYLEELSKTTQFTVEDGLAGNRVRALVIDRDEVVWVGTSSGVSRYDGSTWKSFTTQNGLPHNEVFALAVDQNGALWAGTKSGVCRFDGRMWMTLKDVDHLTGQTITAILPEGKESIWFGTNGGGAVRYNGRLTQAYTEEDGLTSNRVYTLYKRMQGDICIGTDKGMTCYRHHPSSKPVIRIDAVIGDRRYAPADTISMPTNAEAVIIEFHGISFKTRPGALLYRYRLRGYDETWRITRSHQVVYRNLPPARYAFEVVAVDRNLASSHESAHIALVLHDPPDLRNREHMIDWLRLETAGMQASTDLKSIVAFIRNGCLAKHIPLSHFGYCIIREQDEQVELTLIDKSGGLKKPLCFSPDTVPLFKAVVSHWRRRQLFTTSWESNEDDSGLRFVPIDNRVDLTDLFSPVDSGHLHFIPFVQGMLFVGGNSALSEDDLNLVEAVAGAFSVTYARYLDFQLAEAQSEALESQNRELTEANVRLMELDKLKSEFLSHVSHDLRTPLTAIRRGGDNLIEGVCGPLNERQEKTVARIQRNGLRLTDLIEELLDFARLEAGRIMLDKTNVDLKEIAAAVIEEIMPLAQAKKLSLQLADSAAPAPVKADPKRMYQIVTNLIGNAVKYTDQGRIEISTLVADEMGKLVVTDTGRGIAPEERDQIFESFYQVGDSSVAHEGSGLGLAIVRKLIRMHDGEIGLESTIGEGSIFWITLPVIPPIQSLNMP